VLNYIGSRNHAMTKFSKFVRVVCGILCSKYSYKGTTVDEVIVKILKLPMDPSSWTREWLPSFLILSSLWARVRVEWTLTLAQP